MIYLQIRDYRLLSIDYLKYLIENCQIVRRKKYAVLFVVQNTVDIDEILSSLNNEDYMTACYNIQTTFTGICNEFSLLFKVIIDNGENISDIRKVSELHNELNIEHSEFDSLAMKFI